LSYSSQERQTALRLKCELERLGVAVRLDLEALQPGQGIAAFIRESIRGTTATLLLVSQASLVSDWVGLEIGTSLADITLWGKRTFVAGYLDDCFFDPEFRLRATDIIDARLKKIDDLLPDYIERKLDTNDLNAQKSRWHKLRNELGNILDFLKGSLSVDLRGEQFELGLRRLADILRRYAPGAPQALGAASDIEQRRDEIYDLVENAEGERALKRIMDFLRDFSGEKGCVRRITVEIGNFREIEHKLEAEPNRATKELRSERTEILLRALELLDGVVESLTRKAA
jgi:hypothetical protein